MDSPKSDFSSLAVDRGRILLIKPSSLGDIVHTIPVLSALKEYRPGMHVTWLVKRRWADLVARVEDVDRVWPMDEGVASWLRQAYALRAERFDIAIDLQGLFRTAAVAFLCGASKKIGFANGREGSTWFYTELVPVPTVEVHAVDRYLSVLAALGIRLQGSPRFRFKMLDSDIALVRTLFHREGISVDRPWVAMNISARWTTKRWPISSFAAVLDQLHDEGIGPVVLIGSDEDRPDAEQLRTLAKHRFIDLTGTLPLGCLPALLSQAAVMVTNDSGPMHIAAAVGIPVVALFGPTSSIRTGPYGARHHVLTGQVPCRPCFSRVCRHSPELECLHLIKPIEVVEAVRQLMTTVRLPQ